MKPLWARVAGLGALAVAAMLAVGTAAPAQSSGDAEGLLNQARTANAHQSYAGVLNVEWRDHETTHAMQTFTHVVDGAVEVGGGSERILSQNGDRWVGSPGAWSLLVGPDASAAASPDPSAHWRLTTTRGPTVAGRATTDVVATDPGTGAPRARFYIDPATGTLLRRDVLDSNGHLVREVSFEELVPLGDAAAPVEPRTSKGQEPVGLGRVPNGYAAPSSVGRGYRLLGRYRQPDGTVQAYYGDGLFTLSLFEQRGTVDWSALPHGTSQQVNGVTTHTYATPTNSVVVWGAHDLVVTCVSDAPPDQVMRAVHDVVGGGNRGSVVKDVAHFVLGPFGWD